MDCSLPGSSVHGIFQAIVLKWIAISFPRGSSRPKDRTQVSRIVDRRFTIWATREVPKWEEPNTNVTVSLVSKTILSLNDSLEETHKSQSYYIYSYDLL